MINIFLFLFAVIVLILLVSMTLLITTNTRFTTKELITGLLKSKNKWLYFRQHTCVHNWTSAALEDIPPTPKQLESIEGFYDYSKLYCKKCKFESTLNRKW